MNAAQTPGKWLFRHRKGANGDYHTEVFSEEHGGIAVCDWTPKYCGNGVTETYREANARLIAAAPLMLEALEELFGAELEKCMAYDGHDDQMEAVEKARAAIAAATSQPPKG